MTENDAQPIDSSKQAADPYSLATARFDLAKKTLSQSANSWHDVQNAYNWLASLSPMDLPEELRLTFLEMVHLVNEAYSRGPTPEDTETCKRKILKIAEMIESQSFDMASTDYRNRVFRSIST